MSLKTDAAPRADNYQSVSAAPSSESRLRSWLVRCAWVAGPMLLLFLYYRMTFSGLTHPEAMDFAQLGRNIESGHGFSTQLLRPLSLGGGGNLAHQPDTSHGPLFPFLLALAFGILGAKDSVAAGVSGLFFLVTLPVLYSLGKKMFNPTIAAIATAAFAINGLALQYATSGMHITLYIFLTTCLFSTLYEMARTDEESHGARFPRGLVVRAGLLSALLYLTDPIFIFLIPVAGIAVVGFNPAGRTKAALWFSGVAGALMLPWMVRNGVLSGNPIFGLRIFDLWMNTQLYPGNVVYRMSPNDLTPGVELFKSILHKIALNASTVMQDLPQMSASWILAFFLPCLFFRFADPAANQLRKAVLYSFLGLFLATSLLSLEMPLFVALVPTMLIFSIAYLAYLVRQAQLKPSAVAQLSCLLGGVVLFPLLSAMFLQSKPDPLPEAQASRALESTVRKNEVIFSDQPWIVAWYGNRPSVWLPASDQKVQEIRNQFGGARWLMLTAQARSVSGQWQTVYDLLQRWNLARLQAEAAQKPAPNPLQFKTASLPDNYSLLRALNGFVSFAPKEEIPPSVVMAAVPLSRTASAKIGPE